MMSTDTAEKKQDYSQLYKILCGWPQAQSMPENTVPSAPVPATTLSLGLTNAAGLPCISHHAFSILQELQTLYLVSPFSQCHVAQATYFNS